MSLLSVRDLRIAAGRQDLVEDVGFDLAEGEVLGLVGESGSGKTVTCRALMRLLPEGQLRIAGGSIVLNGRDLVPLREAELRKVRTDANPAGRFGTIEEFGDACAFLCSAQAGFITGQSLLMDGGHYPGTF